MKITSVIAGLSVLACSAASAQLTTIEEGFITDRRLDTGHLSMGDSQLLSLDPLLIAAILGNDVNLRMGMPVRLTRTALLGLVTKVELITVDEAVSATNGNTQLPPINLIADEGLVVSIEEGALPALPPIRLPYP